MSETIEIKSFKGPYRVRFFETVAEVIQNLPQDKKNFFLVDRRVFELYKPLLKDIESTSVLLDATEKTKSLDALTEVISGLLHLGLRRGDRLIAIGGGIIQDITAFLATTLYRGVNWSFVPTTLLAQADSCIGSKSSINVAGYKNLLGTFNPPEQILISPAFLKTLKHDDLQSGIGEIIKVHMIDGPASFKTVENDYPRFFTDPLVLKSYIARSLEIKKKIIEVDEFDQNGRNILNYGHSFGHAIESATDFAIPHGIAVTIGMDMANFTAFRLQRWTEADYKKFQPLLRLNSGKYYTEKVDIEKFISAIANDKKNSNQHLNLILPTAEGQLEKTAVQNDDLFRQICDGYLNEK